MKRLLCLMYHRVNSINDSVYNLTVSPENFEQHIKFLKNNFDCYRFEEKWLVHDRPAVVITFDDGYNDNYTYALPILEKYQIPATIFVTTGNLNTRREFWWDELVRLLTVGKNYPDTFTLKDEVFHYTWETDTKEKRIELAKTLRWLLRREPDILIREEWFGQLSDWGGVTENGREENASLSYGALKKMQNSEMITIGAHTVNHISLGVLSEERQRKEIVDSLQAIKNCTGIFPTVFSYPFGLNMDFNQDTIKICKEAGIIKAVTTIPKLWHREEDPYHIPRMAVRDWDIEIFQRQIDSWLKEG